MKPRLSLLLTADSRRKQADQEQETDLHLADKFT